MCEIKRWNVRRWNEMSESLIKCRSKIKLDFVHHREFWLPKKTEVCAGAVVNRLKLQRLHKYDYVCSFVLFFPLWRIPCIVRECSWGTQAVRSSPSYIQSVDGSDDGLAQSLFFENAIKTSTGADTTFVTRRATAILVFFPISTMYLFYHWRNNINISSLFSLLRISIPSRRRISIRWTVRAVQTFASRIFQRGTTRFLLKTCRSPAIQIILHRIVRRVFP